LRFAVRDALIVFGAAPFALAACSVDERTLAMPDLVPITGDGGAGGAEPTQASASAPAAEGSDSEGSAGGGAGAPSGEDAGPAAGGAAPCADLDLDGTPDCEQTLLLNGAFDRDASAWSSDANAQATWSPTDATALAGSGSLEVTNTTSSDGDGFAIAGAAQCAVIASAVDYRVFLQVYLKGGQGQGNGGFELIFYGTANCGGAALGTESALDADTDVWRTLSKLGRTPDGTGSVSVKLVAVKPMRGDPFAALFDNVLLADD
jgi:hypothetical protein